MRRVDVQHTGTVVVITTESSPDVDIDLTVASMMLAGTEILQS
jgi:hypothetical protein